VVGVIVTGVIGVVMRIVCVPRLGNVELVLWRFFRHPAGS
jgi:hypothetical protein